MDLQAIEARLRANEAGRDGELYEHAPKDMRALIDEVGRLTVEHLEMRIERDDLRERRDYYRKALMKADGEIEAVKAMHFPADLKLYAATVQVCATCEVHEWPCPTMRALGVTE